MPAVKRTDYSKLPLADQYTYQKELDPNFDLPSGYYNSKNNPGVVEKTPDGMGGFMDRHGWELFAGIPTAGTLGGLAAGQSLIGTGAGAGAGAAANAAGPGVTSGIPAGSTIGTNVGVPGGSVGKSTLGKIGSWLSGSGGGRGLDPTALLLGGLSMLGGEQDPFQKKVSYSGQGAADPVAALNAALSQITTLQNGLMREASQPVHSNAVVQAGPKPISIPGLDFQIGGGFGMDPALRDPSILTRPGMDFSPMPNAAKPNGQGPTAVPGGGSGPTTPGNVRRRNPGSAT